VVTDGDVVSDADEEDEKVDLTDGDVVSVTD
jgi:hypothetical protein